MEDNKIIDNAEVIISEETVPVESTAGMVVSNNDMAQAAVAVNTFANRKAFQEVFDIGKMLAVSNLVPETYRGKPQDCAIAIDMANRMSVSPMFVMQNLYVVKGKPSWSGQACTALIKASGEFKNVSPEYVGEVGTDTRGCYISATRVSDGKTIAGPLVDMKMVKAEGWSSNKKWQTMPELMLAYRAAAFFARIYIPNALMGCHIEGEAEDIAADSSISKSEAVDPFANKNQEAKK